MVTKKDKELVSYWKNWKPGMGNYKAKKDEPIEIKLEPPKVEVNLDRLAEDVIDRLWDII